MIPVEADVIVADSSFYICFLEDIHRSDALLLFLNTFEFALGDKIQSEIGKCEHYYSIKGNEHIHL
jgi:hypothetical protein